jgi:hypothetical protein
VKHAQIMQFFTTDEISGTVITWALRPPGAGRLSDRPKPTPWDEALSAARGTQFEFLRPGRAPMTVSSCPLSMQPWPPSGPARRVFGLDATCRLL